MIVCELYVYISLDIIDVKVQSDIQMKVINKRSVIVQWSYHLSSVITAKKIGTHPFLMYAG